MIRAIPPHLLAESQAAAPCPSFKHPAVALPTGVWQREFAQLPPPPRTFSATPAK